MRIALVAPLAEAVPPKLYGGTERVVSWLAEELVRQGHKVTLFASGGSRTAANLVVCAPQSLRLAGIRDHLAINVEATTADLSEAPDFTARGGFIRARALFGGRLPRLLEELTDALVA